MGHKPGLPCASESWAASESRRGLKPALRFRLFLQVGKHSLGSAQRVTQVWATRRFSPTFAPVVRIAKLPLAVRKNSTQATFRARHEEISHCNAALKKIRPSEVHAGGGLG
jgi:hypothetical protein